jgi:hypothetical protein
MEKILAMEKAIWSVLIAVPWEVYSIVQTGDLVYVQILGNKLLVLNDIESMRELLEKRSQKYSDRPSFVMAKYMGIENVSTYRSARQG